MNTPQDSLPNSQTNMNTLFQEIFIGFYKSTVFRVAFSGAVLLLLAKLLFFTSGASAQKDYSEDVKRLVTSITAEQTNFAAAALVEESAKKAMEQAAADKFNSSVRARGDRFKLCTLHGLKLDEKGTPVEATTEDCLSFQ